MRDRIPSSAIGCLETGERFDLIHIFVGGTAHALEDFDPAWEQSKRRAEAVQFAVENWEETADEEERMASR